MQSACLRHLKCVICFVASWNLNFNNHVNFAFSICSPFCWTKVSFLLLEMVRLTFVRQIVSFESDLWEGVAIPFCGFDTQHFFLSIQNNTFYFPSKITMNQNKRRDNGSWTLLCNSVILFCQWFCIQCLNTNSLK